MTDPPSLAADSVVVRLSEASDRQILVSIHRKLTALEAAVSDISDKADETLAEVAETKARVDAALTELPALVARNAELEAAIAAEREAAAALLAAEDAEDVDQNAALEAAQAETNRLMADQTNAIATLDQATSELRTIAPETPTP